MSGVDCMDGVRLEMAYGIELYLRRLYLTLKSQSFDVDDNVRYVGSRQQCLYGCVCFVVMFFEAYDNFDAVGMKNVDWLMCIVLDRGCNDLNGDGGKVTIMGKWEKMVLEGVGGGKKVHLSVRVRFGKYEKPERWHDRSWKLRVVSSSCATVERGMGGEWYKKLFKNHAAIHDTFGFLINQHNIGPGYMYGMYSDIKVESQHWWNRCCFMGQLSGLYVLGRLMKGEDIESFSSFDVHDKRERLYDCLLPSSDNDGRTRTPRHQDARRRGTHV